MRRFFFLAILLNLCSTGALRAQPAEKLASYRAVVQRFYSDYGYSGEGNDVLRFAKTKQGWLVQQYDQIAGTVLKSDLYWAVDETAPRKLTNYGEPLSGSDKDREIDQLLGPANDFDKYGYERVRYYGYEGWDADMIADFGSKTGLSDTLLDGLSRAYSYYASRFATHSAMAGVIEFSPLQKPLGPLERPSKERIDSMLYLYGKSLEASDMLLAKNPLYQTKVGNAAMKGFGDRMHTYFMLSMNGYPKEAQHVLDGIRADDNIRTLGQNYLNACPPNSILITYGDNDTYPLWFVQEKEGFRKDVTVINNSLCGLPLYVEGLRLSNKVRFRLSRELIEKFSYALRKQDPKAGATEMSTQAVIALFEKQNKDGLNGEPFSYPNERVILRLSGKPFPAAPPPATLSTAFHWGLGIYITADKLLALDILTSNYETRPLLLTFADDFYGEQLLPEGLVYRVLPLTKKQKDLLLPASYLRTETFLKTKFKSLEKDGARQSLPSNFTDNWLTDMMAPLIEHYAEKDLTHARALYAWLKKVNPKVEGFSFAQIQLGLTLVKMGQKEDGMVMLERVYGQLKNYQQFPNSLTPDVTAESLTQYRNYIIEKLESLKIPASVTDRFN